MTIIFIIMYFWAIEYKFMAKILKEYEIIFFSDSLIYFILKPLYFF